MQELCHHFIFLWKIKSSLKNLLTRPGWKLWFWHLDVPPVLHWTAHRTWWWNQPGWSSKNTVLWFSYKTYSLSLVEMVLQWNLQWINCFAVLPLEICFACCICRSCSQTDLCHQRMRRRIYRNVRILWRICAIKELEIMLKLEEILELVKPRLK